MRLAIFTTLVGAASGFASSDGPKAASPLPPLPPPPPPSPSPEQPAPNCHANLRGTWRFRPEADSHTAYITTELPDSVAPPKNFAPTLIIEQQVDCVVSGTLDVLSDDEPPHKVAGLLHNVGGEEIGLRGLKYQPLTLVTSQKFTADGVEYGASRMRGYVDGDVLRLHKFDVFAQNVTKGPNFILGAMWSSVLVRDTATDVDISRAACPEAAVSGDWESYQPYTAERVYSDGTLDPRGARNHQWRNVTFSPNNKACAFSLTNRVYKEKHRGREDKYKPWSQIRGFVDPVGSESSHYPSFIGHEFGSKNIGSGAGFHEGIFAGDWIEYSEVSTGLDMLQEPLLPEARAYSTTLARTGPRGGASVANPDGRGWASKNPASDSTVCTSIVGVWRAEEQVSARMHTPIGGGGATTVQLEDKTGDELWSDFSFNITHQVGCNFYGMGTTKGDSSFPMLGTMSCFELSREGDECLLSRLAVVDFEHTKDAVDYMEKPRLTGVEAYLFAGGTKMSYHFHGVGISKDKWASVFDYAMAKEVTRSLLRPPTLPE